jgi:hypothetical protein
MQNLMQSPMQSPMEISMTSSARTFQSMMRSSQMTRLRAALMLAGLALVVPACSGKGPDRTAIPLDWQEVADSYAPGALVSVWAGGPDDVWVVGGERGRSVVLHFDGTGWESRDPGLREPLWWVHGFPGGPVFVAGDHGAIARWDDGAWETLDSGAPGTLFYGIWGAAPDDIWAVGGPTQTPASGVEPEGDVVLHYDGSAWTRVEIQALLDKPASQGKNLFKVWGASASEVFIVGDSGMALHYDGSAWTRVDTGVSNQPLFTVIGRDASDVDAVGGLAVPVLIRWDGTRWNDVTLPTVVPQVIQGVWTAPGEAVYLAGWYGFTASLDLDGTWEVVETGSPLAYHAVSGDGDGALWAVGGDIYSVLSDHEGTIITTRTEVPAP